MKKFFLMVIVAVLCSSFFLAGCQEEQENVSKVSSDVISQEYPNGLLSVQREETEKNNQVRLELSAAQYPVDVEKISFLLINEGKQDVGYGYGSFYLEVEKGNIWYDIPVNGIKEMRKNLPVAYEVTHEIFLDQKSNPKYSEHSGTSLYRYDYHPGHYRLVFETPEIGWTSAEFDLVK